MKLSLVLFGFLSLSLPCLAQQDLNDPAYIYSNVSDASVAASIRTTMATDDGVAILLNGKLYKDVNFSKFYTDSGLVYYEDRIFYTKPREIAMYTNDTSIKVLFLFDRKNPAKIIDKR